MTILKKRTRVDVKTTEVNRRFTKVKTVFKGEIVKSMYLIWQVDEGFYIHSKKKIQEKYYEYSKDLVLAFLDMEKPTTE